MAPIQTDKRTRVLGRPLQRGLPRAISGRRGSISEAAFWRSRASLDRPAERNSRSSSIRHIANAPTGILDFLLVEAIVWAKRPRLPSRKPWLGAAAGARPSGHGVTMGAAWNLPVPSRRALLGLQRTAPSQGQVCSALGAALCQLPARSRFGSRPPGFGGTGGMQFRRRSCSKNLSVAASVLRFPHRRTSDLSSQ